MRRNAGRRAWPNFVLCLSAQIITNGLCDSRNNATLCNHSNVRRFPPKYQNGKTEIMTKIGTSNSPGIIDGQFTETRWFMMLIAADNENKNPHVRPTATASKPKTGTPRNAIQAQTHHKTAAAPISKTPCHFSGIKSEIKNTKTAKSIAAAIEKPNRFQSILQFIDSVLLMA